MTQLRLMILHVHKNNTDNLNLIDIGNEFVAGSAHCQQIFGKFMPTDYPLVF